MKRKPVMVLTGDFWAGACGRGLADGFRDLGWVVQEVDRRDFRIRTGGNMVLQLASRLTRRSSERAYRRSLLDECCVLKPDVFLSIKGTGISNNLLREIKESGARTAVYYPDLDFDHPGLSIDSFAEYDLFVTTKTFQLADLEGVLGRERVAYVPHGYVSSTHRPVIEELAERDYRVDLLYPGNHSAHKQKWLEDAFAKLSGCSLEIIGNGWHECASEELLSRCQMRGERTGAGYAEAIQSARINIAVHFGRNALGWEDRVSTRTFEIPACKGFMLHIDNEEVREFFSVGDEIDVFATPEELVDKIRFYLARPGLRARMIERAYARAVPAYSYGARAEQIAALLEERLGA